MTTTSPPPAPAHGSAPTPTGKQPWKWLVRLVPFTALTVSLLSLVVAVTALADARAARDEATTAGLPAEPTAGRTPTAPATDPVDTPTITEPPPTDGPQATDPPPQSFDPQADFTERYSGEVLNPQVTSYDEAYLDLDEPRVVFDSSAADVVLRADGYGNDPPSFDLGQSTVTAAEVGDPQATPADCLERLRTSPLPPSVEVPAQRGTVLCVLTSLTRAAEQGINQKMVILHVSALGDEGRVTIEANAWDQPH